MKKYLSVGCGKLHEKTTEEIEWTNLDKFENQKKLNEFMRV